MDINTAVKAAEKSEYIYRLGAVVVRKGKIVGVGYNKIKSHPVLMRKYGYHTIHSECDAIMKAAAKGDTLIVVRILKDGKLTCSKPCEKCLQFISDYGIKNIYYTNWNGEIESLKV